MPPALVHLTLSLSSQPQTILSGPCLLDLQCRGWGLGNGETEEAMTTLGFERTLMEKLRAAVSRFILTHPLSTRNQPDFHHPWEFSLACCLKHSPHTLMHETGLLR